MPIMSSIAGLELGNALRFHLACVNPIQYKYPDYDQYYGYWNIPLVQTDDTGPGCWDEDSTDNVYMDNVLAELEACVAGLPHSTFVLPTHLTQAVSVVAFECSLCASLSDIHCSVARRLL
jgi:hypothetical protein